MDLAENCARTLSSHLRGKSLGRGTLFQGAKYTLVTFNWHETVSDWLKRRQTNDVPKPTL